MRTATLLAIASLLAPLARARAAERTFAPATLPPGHPAIDQGGAPAAADQMTSKELLEKLDSMKDQLKDRPKTAEIEYALGNLYYENGRYLEAIDYYRRLLERTAPAMQRYLEVRKEPHRTLTPEQSGCPASAHPSYDQLIAIADAKAKAGNASAAVTCYEAALLPVVVAKARRANAFFLIGNPDESAREHREVLAIEPDFVDSLFFLGAVLYESGDGDSAKLEQARDAWTRYLATDPAPDRAKLVRENLAKIAEALKNGGHLPEEAPQAPMTAMGNGPIRPPPPAPTLTRKQQSVLKAACAEGQKLLGKHAWADALAAFGRARAIDPADPDAATGAGIALLNLGKRVEAEGALRDALGRDPHHGLALYELGEVFFENEHYAGASRFWTQLKQQDPGLAAQYGVDGRLAEAQAKAQ